MSLFESHLVIVCLVNQLVFNDHFHNIGTHYLHMEQHRLHREPHTVTLSMIFHITHSDIFCAVPLFSNRAVYRL